MLLENQIAEKLFDFFKLNEQNSILSGEVNNIIKIIENQISTKIHDSIKAIRKCKQFKSSFKKTNRKTIRIYSKIRWKNKTTNGLNSK